ncbi:RHS repeat-associated protein [Rahnella inusitata]|nr:RHS repeat-associated protein [Rahnella inusitata]
MSLKLTGTSPTGCTLLTTDGKARQTFHYGPSGSTNNLHETTPGFNGERHDPLTGSSHLGNGYRAYSPVLMRFTCPDSLSPFGKGGINAYVYCEADPVNNVDPSGHALFRKILTAVNTVLDSVEELNAVPKVVRQEASMSALEAESASTSATQVSESILKKTKSSALRSFQEAAPEAGSAQSIAPPEIQLPSGAQEIMPLPDPAMAENPGMVRRKLLGSRIPKNYSEDSIYPKGVEFVNTFLQNHNIGLSEHSLESISENLARVHAGERTQSAASLREFRGFAKDTVDYLRAGDVKNASITAAGSAINLAGSTLFLPILDRTTFPIWQRAPYDAMDFIQ